MSLIGQISLLLIVSCLNWLNFPYLNQLLAQDKQNSGKITKIAQNQPQCPREIPALADLLVKEISDYTNRVIQTYRFFPVNEDFLPVYVITAGKPELEPIIIQQTQYRQTKENHIEQIFFTTLERQYPSSNRAIQTQNSHWLLLTPTSQGWQMVMLLTRFGTANDNSISSPPQDTTNGAIGQAVRLWLRDCQS